MKKILLLLVFVSIAFAQRQQDLYPYTSGLIYTNSDTVNTIVFPIYDSLAVMLYAGDSVNVDVYLKESATGKVFKTGSKLMDFIATSENDTSFIVKPSNPALYGSLYLLFNSTGNDTDTTGYFRAVIKHYKSDSNY